MNVVKSEEGGRGRQANVDESTLSNCFLSLATSPPLACPASQSHGVTCNLLLLASSCACNRLACSWRARRRLVPSHHRHQAPSQPSSLYTLMHSQTPLKTQSEVAPTMHASATPNRRLTALRALIQTQLTWSPRSASFIHCTVAQGDYRSRAAHAVHHTRARAPAHPSDPARLLAHHVQDEPRRCPDGA